MLRTIDERPAWRADEAVTVGQGLHASTVAPAWLEGAEDRRGRQLVPGRSWAAWARALGHLLPALDVADSRSDGQRESRRKRP